MREIIYCPGCQRRLHLPDEAVGQLAQCPGCQRTFQAELSLSNPPPSTRAAAAPLPTPARLTPPRRNDSDYDLDRRRRRREDEIDDDIGRRGRRAASHRGGEILTFGLLALLPCPVTSIIFGLIAWIMANGDLQEMRVGRMDREGEGLTQAGRALGITGLFLWTAVYFCVFLGFIR
jgi:hypothetical protein